MSCACNASYKGDYFNFNNAFFPVDEKEKYDPTSFRDAIIQGLNETDGDLEKVIFRGSIVVFIDSETFSDITCVCSNCSHFTLLYNLVICFILSQCLQSPLNV